ncbi:hypothetical protein GOODEAATRI_021336, partial [Goodea atripinnis]
MVEQRMMSKLLVIRDNASHPLYHILAEQSSSRSGRLISLRSCTERHKRSLLTTAIRL